MENRGKQNQLVGDFVWWWLVVGRGFCRLESQHLVQMKDGSGQKAGTNATR